MKTSVLKFSLGIFAFLLFSCNKDETTPSNPAFFNLKVGNTWVYKEYIKSVSYPDPEQYQFSGIIDTVKIVGIENIQGLTFAKKITKKVDLNVNNGSVFSDTYTYVRVDSSGHLVEISDGDIALGDTRGLVLHPGFDKKFSYNRIVSFPGDPSETPIVYGNIEYKLYPSVNMVVEGKNYLVSPYNGVFTPTTDHPELPMQTVEYNYSQNIGLVKSVCGTVSGTSTTEQRLVSYDLK